MIVHRLSPFSLCLCVMAMLTVAHLWSAPARADGPPQIPLHGSYLKLLESIQDSDGFSGAWQQFRAFPMMDRANRLLKESRFEEALAEVETLLAVEPEYLPALWVKAYAAYRSGRAMTAGEALEGIIKKAPNFAPALFFSAIISEQENELPVAFDRYAKAYENRAELTPNDQKAVTDKLLLLALKLPQTQAVIGRLRALNVETSLSASQRDKFDELERKLAQSTLKSEDKLLSELKEKPDQKSLADLLEAADNLLNGGDAQAAYTLLTANESKAAIAQGTHSVKQLQDYERLLATAALRAWKLSPEQGAYLLGRASELGVADRLSLAEYYYGKLDYSKALAAVTNNGALLKTEAMTKNVAERYLIVILEISLKQKNLVLASTAGNALIALPSSFEGIVQLSELAKGSDWRRQALSLIEIYLDKNKGLVANAPADSREKLIEASLVLAEEAGDLSLSLKVIDELEGDVKNWQKLAEIGQSQLKLGKPEVALKVLTLAKTVADKQPTISALDNLLYSEMMLDKAEAYFSLSKPQEGYQALVDAYEREPIPQTILRGVALIKGAEPYQAILTDWLNLTSQPGDNSVERAAALLQVARELKSDGELELALHVYELSNTLHPQAEARLEAGYLALDLQKSSKAIDLVKEDQAGATQEAAGRIRCEAFRQQGRTGEALSCALNEAAGNPTDAQALKNVAYYANLTGNVGTAARFLERLYQVEPTLETAKQLAFLYEKTEPSKAVKWFTIAFDRYGDQQAGMTLLYGALKRGDWNSVARVLPRLQLSKLSRKQQGEVYEARARLTLERAGSSDEERREAVVAALADMKKSSSLQPTTQNRYSIVALTFELGEVEEAEREYQALPKAEQETVIALNTGGFIADTLGEYSLAASRFERSLSQDIDQPFIVENLAFTYLRDYNNQGAADMFRLRLEMMQAPSPDLEEEQKRQQFQRQLRILEIPFSFLAFNGMSPSRQNIPLAGGVLGVPSSSPFGSVEVTYRPPYIGFLNGRVFEFIGRTQWANKRGGFRPDPDTWQGVIGARFKPFETQNLKLGIEKFLKIGDLTQDNWLIRALWSVTYGGGFLPLIDPETGQPKTGGLYYNLYLEGGKFLEKEATALFYGDARIGYSFNVSGNTIVLPFIYSIGSGNWNDNIDAFAAEAGIGAIIKYRGFENQFYGPLVNIELIGRLGHEIYNNNADLTDRILLGLQASF